MDPQRAVSDERDDVEHRPVVAEVVEVLAEAGPGSWWLACPEEGGIAVELLARGRSDRRRGIPAVPRDQGRDALARERGQDLAVVGVGDDEVAVRVDVDEAGRDDAIAGVDDRLRAGVLPEPAHRLDVPVPDADVGREPGIPGAVDDTPVPDEDVEARHAGSCRRRQCLPSRSTP